MIGNGSEGEPASSKDAAVLLRAPHEHRGGGVGDRVVEAHLLPPGAVLQHRLHRRAVVEHELQVAVVARRAQRVPHRRVDESAGLRRGVERDLHEVGEHRRDADARRGATAQPRQLGVVAEPVARVADLRDALIGDAAGGVERRGVGHVHLGGGAPDAPGAVRAGHEPLEVVSLEPLPLDTDEDDDEESEDEDFDAVDFDAVVELPVEVVLPESEVVVVSAAAIAP